MKLRPSAANAPSSHRLGASDVGALTGGIVLLVALSVACTRDAAGAQPSERSGRDVAAVTAAQGLTLKLAKMTLRKVATLHDDSVARGRRSSTVFVRPAAAHAAVVRFTIDNPCGVRVRVGARESPQRTLTLQPIGNWQRPGICPGLVNLETYTATITGLRAGEWRVRADSLMPGTVSGFTIR